MMKRIPILKTPLFGVFQGREGLGKWGLAESTILVEKPAGWEDRNREHGVLFFGDMLNQIVRGYETGISRNLNRYEIDPFLN